MKMKIFHHTDFQNVNFYQALCFAKSKLNLALAYANRSATYLELEKYDECLLNIQWARENDYPEEKIQKLNEREEQCRSLMDEKYENQKQILRDVFKLSYPANPKIPFIVDCLMERKIESYSKGVFATRDLKAGDVIAIEDPFGFLPLCYYTCCCVCMKGNLLNLIPGKKNATFMFCSQNCMEKLEKFTLSNLYGAPFIFRK